MVLTIGGEENEADPADPTLGARKVLITDIVTPLAGTAYSLER